MGPYRKFWLTSLSLVLWLSCSSVASGSSQLKSGGQDAAPVAHGVTKDSSGQTPQLAARKPLAYAKLPLHFEANQGQTDPQVKFLARGKGYTLFLTPDEAVLALHRSHKDRGQKGETQSTGQATGPDSSAETTTAVLRMRLVGANPAPQVTGLEELPGKSNYFIGNDPTKWRTKIPNYGKVKYEEVYPGIDLIYYGDQRRLEYDFVVAAGADPQSIRFAFEGADRIEIDDRGDLVLRTGGEEIRLHKPVVYQNVKGTRHHISSRYVLRGKGDVGLQLAAYDPGKPLVIDPILEYSSYVGGSNFDEGNAIAVDGLGSAYITGRTNSANFPGTAGSPIQSSNAGGFDVFVANVSADGSTLLWATYLGGSGNQDEGHGIALTPACLTGCDAYVTGKTNSQDFPTTFGAYQVAYGGGDSDAFVARLSWDGQLIGSTYLGGNSSDKGLAIAVDKEGGEGRGNAYVTGETRSTNFPTVNPFQACLNGTCTFTSPSDAFVAKLDGALVVLRYSTYLGGGAGPSGSDVGRAIAVDIDGKAYVTGETDSSNFPVSAGAFDTTCGTDGGCNRQAAVSNTDIFVAKLDPSSSGAASRIYATYIGGSGRDVGEGIGVDGAGHAYVTGLTRSADFPTLNPFQNALRGGADAFVVKVNPTGTNLIYSTYLGGSSSFEDRGHGIVVHQGKAYVVGETASTDFPLRSPVQGTHGGELEDAFVAIFSGDGSRLIFSTYLGGRGRDIGRGIATDCPGNAYVTGSTPSDNFPTASAFQTVFGGFVDAFVTKLNPEIPGTAVLGWGDDSNGQLGDGDMLIGDFASTPVMACGLTDPDVAAIAAGATGHHTLALKGDGTVWSWGTNIPAQLGRPTFPGQAAGAPSPQHTAFGRFTHGSSANPEQVIDPSDPTGFLSGVIAIAAGGNHSLGLKADGTVWAWGERTLGQLGDGCPTVSFQICPSRVTPAQVIGLTNVVAIAAGHKHSLALKGDGTVWAWGQGNFGQLGDGTFTDQSSPVQVSGLTNVVAIAAGELHNLALKSNGEVWAWGHIFFPQPGPGQGAPGQVTDPNDPTTFLTGVIAIAAGGFHSLALKTNGEVWAWGNNSNGQLGDGTTTNRLTPDRVVGSGGVGFLSDIIAIAGGRFHSLALKNDGTVWGWGFNQFSQLGDGTFTDQSSPVQVSGLFGVTAIGAGAQYSLAISTDVDGDGIANSIDGEFLGGAFVRQGNVFSNNFTDQHLGGTTFGSIVDRGGLVVTVIDAPDPAFGVALSASGGTGTASLKVCGFNVFLTEADSTVIRTCSSITAQVLVGPIEIALSADILVSVSTGATVTISEVTAGQFKIENSGSTGTIVLQFQGQAINLGPGQSASLRVCACAGPASGGTWTNHGAYVSCVAQAAESLVAAGLLTQRGKGAIVSSAAQSSCGRKK